MPGMDLVRALILGIVQGLTEFLPVSSSGHLILIPRLFNWPDQGQAFDVALHVGTLVAILTYFWRDWWRMAVSSLSDLSTHQAKIGSWSQDSKLLLYIAAGSVPAAIVGFTLNDWFEENVREPWLIAITLSVAGVILLLAERLGKKTRKLDQVTLLDGVLLGCAQAVALVPGVSRSGITMCAGLFRGFDRDSSARFAFLLGTPAFVGAAILKLPDLAADSNREWLAVGIGTVTSAVVGLLAIHFLMRFIRTRSLMPFVIYRFGVAALTLIIAGIRVA